MEVEKVTVKVELTTPAGKTSVEATAALDFREGRTKEDAAAAAYNLSKALQDSLDAGSPEKPRETPNDGWDALKGSDSWAAPRQPAAPASAPVAQGRFCQINGQELKQYSNAKGSWWSHQHDGEWCKGS